MDPIRFSLSTDVKIAQRIADQKAKNEMETSTQFYDPAKASMAMDIVLLLDHKSMMIFQPFI